MWARENARPDRGPSINGIVRRMVSLPSSILGGVSRAVSLMGTGWRDHFRNPHDQPQLQPQPQIAEALYGQGEPLAFLTSFEYLYGMTHPFFYACQFADVLKVAEKESKLVFVYLHAPEHPYTSEFCSRTLGSDLVVEFLDANFISWGSLAAEGEGLHLCQALRPACFPLCVIVAPASGSNIAVLKQVEGPVSPAELVEILQRTLEEQGSAFSSRASTDDSLISANRRLREEQDAAYQASLLMDKEKDRLRELAIEESTPKPHHHPHQSPKQQRQQQQLKKSNFELEETKKIAPTAPKEVAAAAGVVSSSSSSKTALKKEVPPTQGKDSVVTTKIQIRFPSGGRREQSFLCKDKIQSVYRYIDSLNFPGLSSYRLVSSFPRKVFGIEQMGMTLKEAGLHPRASLFIEVVD